MVRRRWAGPAVGEGFGAVERLGYLTGVLLLLLAAATLVAQLLSVLATTAIRRSG